MTEKTSLQISDAEAAAVAQTPNRISLASIEAKIQEVEFFYPTHARHMTVAAVKLTNGYVVIGQSAPADPANYNKELGEKFAKEDAIRKVWPLEGYALCEKLAA